jgi:hypothetical protein
MTPQEKCELLLIKYYSAHGPNLPFQTAKECAIICVEQIIEWEIGTHCDETAATEYLQEVLAYLKNS